MIGINMNRRKFIIKGLLAFSAFFFRKLWFKGGAAEAAVVKGLSESNPSKGEKMVEPGSRVISVRSEGVTGWDYRSYQYADSVNERLVVKMLNESVKGLTSESDEGDAWRRIFISYKKGDIIAIKPNFNDLYNGFKGFVASPAVLNAIIEGLVSFVRVRAGDIIIYDCTRIIPDEFRDRIRYQVRYVEPFGSSFLRKVRYKTLGNDLVKADLNYEIKMSAEVKNKKGFSVKCYLPKVITGAAHIINVPILKSHQYVSNSGALKNHYGTVRFSDGHTGPEYLHPPILDESIVDINSHPEIRTKTRLIVMDGLFGRLAKKGGLPERWKSFEDKSPDSLLVSADPVALDTVALHLLSQEAKARGEALLPHEYLHIANDKGLGVHEDPSPDGEFKRIDLRRIEI